MYELIVLGGGPAGYRAAERAGAAGWPTLLIERDKIGGVCLHEGCIPSKAFLHSAKILESAAGGSKYGVICDTPPHIDQGAVVARKNKVVRNLTLGIRNTLKNSHVDVREGEGVILGRRDGLIEMAIGGEMVAGRRLLIATGSEAIIPAIPGVAEGLADGNILTSREILDLGAIPASLAVIGGGVVGLEMAGYFQACGAQVSVIEMLDHIAGTADREMADALRRSLEKKGIVFQLGCRVTSTHSGVVEYENDSGKGRLAAEKILLSVGRRPNTSGFGLENLGVVPENGRIVTDAQGRTNVADVYAAGDVTGGWMLAHAAYHEAETAVDAMLGLPGGKGNPAMPCVLYTNPEMAYVGETEESCLEKGLPFRKIKLPMTFSGRYLAENERGDGLAKLLVDPARNRLLGCHLLGGYASEIILAAGLFIDSGMSLDEIRQSIFPHPTVGEIIREAIWQLGLG